MKRKVLNIIRNIAKKVLGIEDYEWKFKQQQEQIDTLNYFLNLFFECSSCKKATGSLRQLQVCDTVLLSIFNEFCKLYGLNYWIDFGILLGAIRHKGFIPWDDDVDVCMPREDYNKALEILPKVLEPLGLSVYTYDEYPSRRIGLSYRHNETGIWMDILPVDSYNENDKSEEEIKVNIRKWCNLYLGKFYNKTQIKVKREEYDNFKNNFLPGLCSFHEANYLLGCLEFLPTWTLLWRKDNVFPLKQTIFEDIMVNIPNNAISHIISIYGKEYMQFPKKGVLHHGGVNGNLSSWSVINKIDMQEIKQCLEQILHKLKDQTILIP